MSSPELAVHCAALFDEALPTQTEGEWAPDLNSYTRVVVALSGGKDSVACLLHLLDLGVPRSKLIAHYHPVDGDGETLMDWPVTESLLPGHRQSLWDPIQHVLHCWGDAGRNVAQ
jgi:hypothetical protein